MPAWVLFTIVRVGLFAVLFAALYAATAQLGSFAWAGAAVLAALLAFCISYIFFGKLRARVAAEMAERARTRKAKAGSDEDLEDRARAAREE
jgi:flagellar biosynthesis/type III secretory pathway M-ring protein FliF/YscJ